ncbi:MAG: LUD domain-containing protein [Chloroflexota bacterium]
MSTRFRERIRQSIDNPSLQAALDANTERRLNVRAAALASLPDWETRRQRAHAVRADVIEHVEEYVAQFSERLMENGVIVHRAVDAAEANRIVLDIIQKQKKLRPSVKSVDGILVAKSKSMVSEEVGLNHALEAAGHRVVETDLGEYIIQLRHERPAHIITPAVHLNRRQVGELFHEKLGIPYTEDIPILTNTARKVLREVFLKADIGVSGVNFGVVENGALTVVTNEGNGRMCTTMPRVHIALMGMERLAPTLDDLALFLSLLPRSATGQKLSVYTQLLRSPRPGQQRHVIIVDNGRTRLKNSPLKESLYCIRCGACLNACPVFRELGGHAYIGADNSIAPYPGPIGSVISPGLLGENYVQLAQASSLCGACKDACPVDIDLPKLLTRVRAGASDQSSVTNDQSRGEALPSVLKFGLRMYTRLATTPRLFAASQSLAALGARLVSPLSAWMRFPAFTGWGYSKDFPRPAVKTFRDGWKSKQIPKYTGTQVGQESGLPTRHNPPTSDLQLSRSIPVGPVTNIVPFGDYQSQFTSELSTLGGTVIACTATELSTKLTEFLRQRGATKVFVDEIGTQKLPDGFEAIREPDSTIKFGLTGCAAGIANTGTILLLDEGETLKASLLPEVHIVVLRTRQLVADLPEALAATRNASNAVLVTGPSRTADIEMTLTIGVHGPKEIAVFLVDDSKGG